jgi:hypothetical protein
MSEHNENHEGPKHLLTEATMTPYQRFMHTAIHRLLELTTLELIVATAHLAITFVAVFGFAFGCSVSEGGGGH